jgi:hypothetical protein
VETAVQLEASVTLTTVVRITRFGVSSSWLLIVLSLVKIRQVFILKNLKKGGINRESQTDRQTHGMFISKCHIFLLRTESSSFERVDDFKYLGINLTNQNSME